MTATPLPTTRSGTSSAIDGQMVAAAVECVTPSVSIPTMGVKVVKAKRSITTTTTESDSNTETEIERHENVGLIHSL